MTYNPSRREWLCRQAALASVTAARPWAAQLAALSAASAAAQTTSDDYRALVCVFLFGGNDHHNTILPMDSASHAAYTRVRSGIALPLSSLQSTELVPQNPWSDGRRMALHPALAPLKPLFDQQRLALMMNVGPLLGPTTLADYNRRIGLPPKLFSHNDQQSVWQAGSAEGATAGWAGRMGDLLRGGNPAGSLFTSVSAAGNAVLMSGREVIQYQVSPGGALPLNSIAGSSIATEALRTLMQGGSPHLIEESHAGVSRRAFAADAQLRSSLAGVTTTPFPADNSLATQLQIIARLIAARRSLGLRRQVFFASLGGFDLHDNLIANHPGLLATVANALRAFHDATVALGVDRQVTTFTASDFGRTLSSNCLLYTSPSPRD